MSQGQRINLARATHSASRFSLNVLEVCVWSRTPCVNNSPQIENRGLVVVLIVTRNNRSAIRKQYEVLSEMAWPPASSGRLRYRFFALLLLLLLCSLSQGRWYATAFFPLASTPAPRHLHPVPSLSVYCSVIPTSSSSAAAATARTQHFLCRQYSSQCL